ncbi:MAG: hypothetical protein B5M54_01820 [Candidatus Aminicenantes bacterium 4484_214]|nr:MAG: hypothetical protein B5M54_01820 [Candidatus Aminicenantes bacterium 4484_214]RLE10922.1 MAG: hypothetical protein DRJ06_00365 [Candidatus Aminicenantes bacterium]HDJ22760.1 hypothetical protein [Candidatus Aminicenantes bacterium]
MRCRQAEKLIHRLLDDRLKPEEIKALETHLSQCPACRQKKKDYELISHSLRSTAFSEPNPYYWEKISSRLAPRPFSSTLAMWKKWALRAVPVALILVIILVSALVFFSSSSTPEMSQAEILLLQDANPFSDSQAIFAESSPVNKNLRLIFTSLETTQEIRR